MNRSTELIITMIVALSASTGCRSEIDDFADDQLRVINGEPAPSSVDEYAATVALHERSGDDVWEYPFCSGTLIAPDVVLTAAHCCDGAKGGKKADAIEPEDAVVYFGEGPAFVDGELDGELYGLSEVRLHPAYDRFNFINDICLLRLSQPNQSSPTVPHLPASLGLSDADAGTLLDHVGFGYSDLDKTELGVKLHIEIPLAGLGCVVEGCWSSGTEGQFSFVQDGDPYFGTCNGDSGGPAFIVREGTTYVAGITSYGDVGCELYGVSTNVSAYQSFIDAFLGQPPGEASCGNGVCEVGESCDGREGTQSCAADCPSMTKGKPSTRYCYVDGACEGPGC